MLGLRLAWLGPRLGLNYAWLALGLAWAHLGLNCAWLALGLAWAPLGLELCLACAWAPLGLELIGLSNDVLRSVSTVLLYLIRMLELQLFYKLQVSWVRL